MQSLRHCPTALAAFLLFAGAHRPAGSTPREAPPDRCWSPLLDQEALRHLGATGKVFLNHPGFLPGQDMAAARGRIRAALIAAHDRGFRVLDLRFLVAPSQLQPDYARDYPGTPRPPVWDPGLAALAVSDLAWLQEVDAFNATHPAYPFRVRLRLQATAANLYYVYRTLAPYATWLAAEDYPRGRNRSRLPGLPLDPCFEKPNPTDPCHLHSPVPGGFYRALSEDGRYTNAVPNLANPALREAIADWASLALRTALSLLGPATVIEEMSLSLDAGSESSLFPGDQAAVVSFSNRAYRKDADPTEKRRFFREREDLLRSTYTGFAAAVHAVRNPRGTPIRAGVFQQAWALDGRARGTFDLRGLLAGTSLDVLHHTQMPLDETGSLMATAFSASVASSLGMGFDSELSWAHFGSQPLLSWDPRHLRAENATAFLGQVRAALRYGAHGITYCSWTLNEILNPPPDPAWVPLIGAKAAAGRPPSAPDLASFVDAGTVPPGAATRALYIGSAGRMECEEKAAHGIGPGHPCTLADYFRWFAEAGYTSGRTASLARGRVQILTDAMVLADRLALAGLLDVFMPFETSGAADSAVVARLRALPAEVKTKFRWQDVKGRSGGRSLEDWLAAVVPIP